MTKDKSDKKSSMSSSHLREQEPLIFPCEFPIKVFGAANDEFEKNVLSIIRKHVPNLAENAISNRLSKEGKYLALTITLKVDSRAELDAIYQDLSASPHVMMAL